MKKSIWQLEDGKWYYVDETEDFNGPYDTEEEAERERINYLTYINQPKLSSEKYREGEL